MNESSETIQEKRVRLYQAKIHASNALDAASDEARDANEAAAAAMQRLSERIEAAHVAHGAWDAAMLED